MNTLAAETASAWYLILNSDARQCLYAEARITVKSILKARHICHASLTPGTEQVSAGAAVITPQRRS